MELVVCSAVGVITTKYMTLRLIMALSHWGFGGSRFILLLEIILGAKPTMDEFN